jgi:hypothetical protein
MLIVSFILFQNAEGRCSFTLDLWSNANRSSYLAMTAHWMTCKKHTNALQLHSELIVFHHMKGRHTGEAIANTVMHLLERADVVEKVSFSQPCSTCAYLKLGGVFLSRQRKQQRLIHARPRNTIEEAWCPVFA